jgi:hypothetical protein
MDKYFEFKLYVDYIIPFLIFVILLVIALSVGIICYLIQYIQEKMISNFFLSYGYKRKLLGVSSVGAKTFYGWVRETDNKIVDDRDIRSMPLKEIKKKYK